jgi:hypothetical protein
MSILKGPPKGIGNNFFSRRFLPQKKFFANRPETGNQFSTLLADAIQLFFMHIL